MNEPVKQEVTVIEQNTQITPMQMLQIAVEKGADVDQMSKLMDLNERWEVNQAKKAFVAALNAFKANPPTLTRDRHVAYKQTSYDHASLDQISKVIGEALSKVGISHRWETNQTESFIGVTCVLTHELGHSEKVYLQSKADDSGGKNAIQAIGSAVTYLSRYTLLAATGLAVQDQDDDGAGTTEMISDEQKTAIIARINDTGTDTVKFLKFMGSDSVDAIPADQFQKAMNALSAKARTNNENS